MSFTELCCAVISLCDTMNYLTEYDDLVNVCRLVNNYLDPNGIFLFDLKTDHYFKSIGCQSFCDADEEVSLFGIMIMMKKNESTAMR